MRVLHQTNERMLKALTASNFAHGVEYWPLVDDIFYRDDIPNGYSILLPTGFGASISHDFIKAGIDFGISEIMIPYEAYGSNLARFLSSKIVDKAHQAGIGFSILIKASKMRYYDNIVKIGCPAVTSIALWEYNNVPYGFERFYSIYQLVKGGKFNSSYKHRLYGISNPAEMVAYRRAFSDYIYQSIDLMISPICFWYSIWGMSFSRSRGVFFDILPSDMSADHRIESRVLSPEQEKLYFLNAEIIEEFAKGKGGLDLMLEYDHYSKSHSKLAVSLSE